MEIKQIKTLSKSILNLEIARASSSESKKKESIGVTILKLNSIIQILASNLIEIHTPTTPHQSQSD